MKKSTFDRIYVEAERIGKMIGDPNVTPEQMAEALSRYLGPSYKVEAPKKKVRRGVGSY
jgi:hypothetical protein